MNAMALQLYIICVWQEDGRARQKAFLVFTAIMSGRDGEWNNLTTTNGLH